MKVVLLPVICRRRVVASCTINIDPVGTNSIVVNIMFAITTIQLLLSGIVVHSLLLPQPRHSTLRTAGSGVFAPRSQRPQQTTTTTTTTQRWMERPDLESTWDQIVSGENAILSNDGNDNTTINGPLFMLVDGDFVGASPVTNSLIQNWMNDTDLLLVESTTTTITTTATPAVRDAEITNDSALPTSPQQQQPPPPQNTANLQTTTTIPSDIIESPSVSRIFQFAIPAVGVWLCNPLLSLIDTSMVGLLSGTTEQAALNPAVAVTDYGALLIAFMYTATTNLVAASHESDQIEGGKPRATNTLVGALQLSSYVGAGLGLVLLLLSKVLLRGIIGNDTINPAVFASAVKYVRIRALGMPAAAIIGSAQAGCLGMQDIRSPLYVLAGAAVINLLGDLIFVGRPHPWIGGAAGAAWATVFSQYAAVFFFMRWLCQTPTTKRAPRTIDSGWFRSRNFPFQQRSKLFDDSPRLSSSSPFRRLRHTLQSSSKDIAGTDNVDANRGTKKNMSMPSSRGCLEGRFRLGDLLKFPQRSTTTEFAPYVFPVTTTQVGRVSSYVAMSHVVSSTLGTTSMAAQQVILSLFYCLCPIADSLNLTAQSFLPGIFGKRPSKQRAQALRQATLNFVKAGALFGAIMAGAVSCVPWFSRMFTADPDVVSLVNMVAPYLVGVFSVHGVVCATEGLLLGQKDLGFLGKMYASYFVAVPFFMLRLKKAALLGTKLDLTSVWTVFLGYQWFRFGAWLFRVAVLQRRAAIKAQQQ